MRRVRLQQQSERCDRTDQVKKTRLGPQGQRRKWAELVVASQLVVGLQIQAKSTVMYMYRCTCTVEDK